MQFPILWLGFLSIFFQPTWSTPFKYRNSPCKATTKLLHQFPLGTWIENIAIRSNGQLLVTLLSTPDLYLIDPFTPSDPVLVHNFPSSLGLTGIAEVIPDAFILTSVNFSLTAGITPNSSIAWKVNLHHSPLTPSSNTTKISTPPTITQITPLNELSLPNGLCTLSSQLQTVLIGDIRTGQIYTLNTLTGTYYPSISNPFTTPAPQPDFGPSGINGIHVRDQTLYFINTGLGIFASLPIHLSNGTAAGDVTIISNVLEGDYLDDFSLREESAYLVTGSGNSVEMVGLHGERERIVVGAENSTVLAEPTAVAWGRTEWDRDVLYVVTAGGLATPVVDGGVEEVVGGQVVAVDFGGCW